MTSESVFRSAPILEALEEVVKNEPRTFKGRMAAFQNLSVSTVRRMIQRVQRKRNGKTVGTDGRSSGRNERIVGSARRDGKRHGPDVNQTVAARALGWRSEVSAVNRTHGPARC